MNSTITNAPTNEPARPVYRCAACGIRSELGLGFVHRDPGHPARGLLCSVCAARRRTLRVLAYMLLSLALPVLPNVAEGRVAEAAVAAMGWLCGVAALAVAVAAHEIGHVVAGAFVGLRATEVTIGRGPLLCVVRPFGIPIEIRALPLPGSTTMVGIRPQSKPWRGHVARLGGPAANLLLAGAALVVPTPVPLAAFFALVVNAGFAVAHFAPRRRPAGAEGDDDAELLARLGAAARAAAVASAAGQARLAMRDGRFEEALAIARSGALGDTNGFTAASTAGLALLELGRVDEARALLCPLPARTEGWQRAIALNNLAWADLTAGDPALLDEADAASAAAVRLWPTMSAVRHTRALVLARRGRPEEGLPLIAFDAQTRFSRRSHAGALCVQATVLAGLGRLREARRALTHAERRDGSCPLLDATRAAVRGPGPELRSAA